ncbi:hypothetical protein PaecuDRAFT_4390 [Paenibacillus curdlanolyticus YK9]|uniref:Uncharacterized protein n=1 Tax=Paenibacillus curdlanolyticus YK9 TaxID=717606 RepID=E0IFE9_9BACL|nr:hypothetical protein [Paenibacillus curdlanolyticus]EFM08925.1 hypothetical protein PaecuDRAFT_4390 [Paenibacillus curdlanolyticus YK9]
MPTLVTNSLKNALNPTILTSKGASTVNRQGGYCFYSDNPESVTNGPALGSFDLVDGGGKRWLNKATVNGAGLVYMWHTNGSGAPFKHALLIYNPNSFAISVSSSNNGLTQSNGGSDIAGWTQYFSGNNHLPTPIVIQPNAFGTIFQQTISAGYNFGIVARTNVVNNSTGAAANAIFYDVAYLNTNIGATDWATLKSPSMRRGVAPTYYNPMNLAEIAPVDTNGIAYRVCGSAANPGVFGTDDIPTVTDYAPTGNNSTGLLEGGFGQQYAVSMKIKNTFTVSKNFLIMIGKTAASGGSGFPFVNMAGVSQSYAWVGPGYYCDMIDTGPVAAGATITVNFFMVVPAVSSTPVIIGARVKP